MFTYDDNTISDLHKDARGFRPSREFFETWEFADADTRQAIWDDLIEELDETMAREKEEQQLAIAEFEHRVMETIRHGAGDRKTAIRWIVDGLDVDGDYSYACYKLGLPYEMATELRGV